jgi:hypothetical protein
MRKISLRIRSSISRKKRESILLAAVEKKTINSTKPQKGNGGKTDNPSTDLFAKLPSTLTVIGVRTEPTETLIILRDESENYYTIPHSGLRSVRSAIEPSTNTPSGPTIKGS